MPIWILIESKDPFSLKLSDVPSDFNILNVLQVFEGEYHNPGIENGLTAGSVTFMFPWIAKRIADLIAIVGISKSNCKSAD